MLLDIKSQLAQELQARFQEWGQPAYRVSQLLEWLFVHRVTDWEAMTNLPRALRDQLRTHYTLHSLELVRKQGSRDTTQKFLWRLADHSLIESVLIPANPALYGEPSDRHTLCVSTQVGCAYGCKFCASGLAGLKRNLAPDEIVDQVMAVERLESKVQSPPVPPSRPADSPGTAPVSSIERGHRRYSETAEGGKSKVEEGEESSVLTDEYSTHHASRITGPSLGPRLISNLVIMGMGEPLANYDNLMRALRILNAPWGGAIGARKITISTSGLAPEIRRLAAEPMQIRLAISLHGATDETRNKLMPVNRKYPLAELTAACEHYLQKKGRMITFEYILIEGINAGLDQVEPLAALARRLKAKVNLIPYNKVAGLPWQRPSESAQEAFLWALERQRVTATLRREKGHDIEAACGQLRLRTETPLAGLA